MKRRFTILTAAFALLAFLAIPMGMRADEAQYVFNTDAGIAALGIEKPSAGAGTSLSTDPYTVGQISMSVTHGSTDTRVWNSSGTLDLRIYKSGGTLTFAAASGYNITGVTIAGSAVGNFSVNVGTYSSGTWSNGTTGASSVTFTATNTGKINTITVTYSSSSAPSLQDSDLALVDAPVELEFDLYDNANAQTISYTTSSTGEVTVSQSDYITATVNANNTITVTPVAVTNGPQTITVNQAADNTYAAGSVTFTVDIEDSTPSTGSDVTFDATVDKDLNNTTQGEGSIVKNGVTFTCSDGILGNGTEYRLYKNSTTTFSVESGTITQIVFTCTSGNPASGFATQTGWTTNGSNGAWTGNATSVSFVASSKQVRATQIVVTVETSGTPDPTISADNVDIAYSATSGSITYTINNEPSPAGTLTAAVTEGNWLTLGQGTTSPIAFTCTANENTTARTATVTLTYTYNTDQTVSANVTVTQAAVPESYTTIPALFAAATSTETAVYVTFNNWVVSGVSTNGKNVYVTDNTGNGFIIYFTSDMSGTFAAGNILSGTAVACKLKLYNGAAELVNLNASDLTITDGGNVSIVDIAMASLSGVNTGALVHYENLTCSLNNNKYYLSDGTTTIQVYNSLFAFDALEDGKTYNITGIYQQYNSTKEILPRSAADIERVYTLTINGYQSDENPGGYYLIASPVTVDLTDHAMTNGDFDLYAFNQAEDDEWRNYKAGAFTNLEPGKGYLYAHKTGGNFTLTGTAYDGEGEIELVYDNNAVDFKGWNLVGNPWGVKAYPDHEFYTMAEGGASIDVTPNVAGTEVAPMTGIFVVAEAANETVTFSTENPNGKSANLALNITNSSKLVDRAIVRFGEGRQLPKFQLRDNSTKIYFEQSNKDYAIVNAEEIGEMPVSFKAENNGTYTFSVNTENVEMEYLHLIDNMTGADIDLIANPSYSFEAKVTDYASRFRLVFSANSSVNEQNANNFAFFNGNDWTINNEGEATLQVVDMTGRVLSTETVNGNATTKVNAATGVYMLRLINGNNIKTQKVVVK